MTEKQLDDWERIISKANRIDIEKWIPEVSDMARPSHPSCGQYTHLLTECAIRLRQLGKGETT